jgi:hypothetical protein
MEQKAKTYKIQVVQKMRYSRAIFAAAGNYFIMAKSVMNTLIPPILTW